MGDDFTVLDILHDILETEQSFYSIARFLDGRTRNHVVAGHLRNTAAALQILQSVMARPATTVITIPLDVSGNFFDNVPVVPSAAQVRTATEPRVPVVDGVCSICQEPLTSATRIRQCGHCFHSACIDQWFSMNPRCPVCRHDIRDGLSNNARLPPNEGGGVHSDEE